ncbi:MAG: F0F1 ATP synthase subunit alpha [Lentisphaerota bacterium]
MENVIEEIKQTIKSFHPDMDKEETGVVIEVGDGVAKIEGFRNVRLNEMLDFGDGIMGIALNLEESSVGAIVLDRIEKVKEGQLVRRTEKLLQIPTGKMLIGRVVDPLGRPIDGKGSIESETFCYVERGAPGIIGRQSVTRPLQTGITSIDAMIPIGRGQRELIIGDRSTGKTAIAIDTIINQAKLNQQALENNDTSYRPVHSVYVAIGQRQASVANVMRVLEEHDAMRYTVIVAANAADSAALQYLAPFSGTAIGEYFMDRGMDALVIYDDLSKHAVAYRQISLVLKRPSGREAFPGDIFYLHSRLLERSACLSNILGGGSLTSLPIIETQAGDVSAYIPTNVISITDGQIYLESDLFHQGIRPAMSVGISVSRVGSAAQIKAMKEVAGRVKLDLAQYQELKTFAQFGSDLDAKTLSLLERGKRIIELFKQGQYSPVGVEEQVIQLWAVQNGFFDTVSVSETRKTRDKLLEFIRIRKKELLKKIRVKNKITPEILKMLQETLMEFTK